jgi:hypothetical protein
MIELVLMLLMVKLMVQRSALVYHYLIFDLLASCCL